MFLLIFITLYRIFIEFIFRIYIFGENRKNIILYIEKDKNRLLKCYDLFGNFNIL